MIVYTATFNPKKRNNMKKWLTIILLALGIVTTVGSCSMAYLNGTATATTASDATTKVVNDVKAIKEAYNASESTTTESATDNK